MSQFIFWNNSHSRSIQSCTMSYSKSSKKPVCKVCRDAGKSDINHWVKDLSGAVACPTLLATKCRKCSQKGHTASYCVQAPAEPKPAPSIKLKAEPTKAVGFMAADFPALGETTNRKTEINIKTGWTVAISKPKPQPQKKEHDTFIIQLEEQSLRKQLPQSAFKVATTKKHRLTDSATGDRCATRKIYADQEMDLADGDYFYDSDY